MAINFLITYSKIIMDETKDNVKYSEFELGNELDLHHFHPRDTKALVNEFLLNAKRKKYKTVRIIHGKGRSRKKRELYKILESHPDVVNFSDDDYNWGAAIIKLEI